MRLTELWRYPVKSCRGTSVDSALVEPWGLAGDRRWMVVDADSPGAEAVTAREVNALVLVHPTVVPGGLRVTAPGVEPLEVVRPGGPGVPRIEVGVHRHRLTATPAGEAADAWFSAVTGRAVRLVWMDDPAQRPTNPEFSTADDRVSLADGYPLLVTTQASLAALGDAIVEGSQGAEAPVEMGRFRPNLVVDGDTAWAEDDWRRIRVGGPDGAVFRAVKGCNRCVMTTVDPDTAERGREPLRTLARTRRWDGATWFGVNLVPDSPGATIRVGDEVEVLDAVAPGDGPVRPRG